MKTGARVVVLPAYEMSTKRHTRFDEYTGKIGTVERVDGSDLLVDLDERVGGVWVHVSRVETR